VSFLSLLRRTSPKVAEVARASVATPKRKVLTGGAAMTAMAVVLIGGFEGLPMQGERAVAYRDIVGIPTVCYGETRGVKMGDSYTREECDDMLVEGLMTFERGMNPCLTNPQALPVKVRVAMLSVTYNVGYGKSGFCGSSMARRINAGDLRGACDALLRWNRAGGREIKGLTRRRQEERRLCLEGLAG
jgi:lysozyme